VLDHYSGLGERRKTLRDGEYDPRLPRVMLSAQERADLVAFLASLTDETFVRRFASVDRYE
jgi:hypothetical protein